MGFDAVALDRAQETIRRAGASARGAGAPSVSQGVAIAEVGGTAVALSYANAKWGQRGGIAIAGIPLDLGLALVATSVALFTGPSRCAEHSANIGAAALTAYACRVEAESRQARREENGHVTQPPSTAIGQRSARRVEFSVRVIPDAPAPYGLDSPIRMLCAPLEIP